MGAGSPNGTVQAGAGEALGVAAGSTGAGEVVAAGIGVVVAAGAVAVSVTNGAAGSSVRLQAQPKTNKENVAMTRLGLRGMMGLAF
jgi:hypothetical protein